MPRIKKKKRKLQLVCVELDPEFTAAAFWQELPVTKVEFMHSAEFKEHITKLEIDFPIVFLREKGRLQALLTARDISNCKDIVDFHAKIERKLSGYLKYT